MKHGFYLQGVPQQVGQGKDVMDMVQHLIVEVNQPISREDGSLFLEKKPTIREVYLKPGVLEVLPAGTPITFELDTKIKRTNEGVQYEKIIPVEIKAVKK